MKDKKLKFKPRNITFDDKYKVLLKKPFAHRGYWGEDAPENSLKAFMLAKTNLMPIELDVHLTEEGKLYVIHDDNLKRMTGVNKFIKFLKEEEISRFRLNDTDEKIPTLDEVLNLVNGEVPILIDIKVEANTSKIAKALNERMKSYKGEVFFESFNPFVLIKLRKLNDSHLLGYLSSFFIKNREVNFIIRKLVKHLFLRNVAKIDFISYDIDNIPNKMTNNSQIPVLAWTVRNKEQKEWAKTYADNYIFEKDGK